MKEKQNYEAPELWVHDVELKGMCLVATSQLSSIEENEENQNLDF